MINPAQRTRSVACLAAWVCLAQPPAPAPGQPVHETTISTNTEEVVVDLVVRNKKGELVRDLSTDQIEITDDGAPVKVKNLRLLTGSAQVKEAQGSLEVRAGERKTIRLVSFVFERFGPDAGQLARETADEMLKTPTEAELYFAVLEVNRRLRLVQQYTTDRAKVRSAVEAVTLGAKSHTKADVDAVEKNLAEKVGDPQKAERLLSGDLSQVNGLEQNMASMMLNSLHESEQISRDMQSRPSLGALLALVKQQGSLPGRKTIVYFSEGLPLTAPTKYMLNSLVEAANRSNVSIYAADVAGLSMSTRTEAGRIMLAGAAQASASNIAGGNAQGNIGSSPSSIPAPSDGVRGISMDQVKAADRMVDISVSDVQGNLIELAKGTGGFFIGDSNDLRKPARRLMEEVASYYEATYVPESPVYDGRFHKLAVKVNRKGLTVQARNGYVAVPPGTPPGIQPFEATLLKHLAAAELPRQLDFRSDIIRFGRGADGVSASVVVELPMLQLEFHEDTNSKMFEVHPTILALLKTESGRVVQKFSQDLPYRGALQAMESLRQGTYTFQRNFTVPPGKMVLEVAVGDGFNNRAGAQRTAVAVPDPPAGTSLSDISMVRRFEALPETAAANELFRYQQNRVVPSLVHTVQKLQAPSIATYFVIYPDAKAAEKPKLELALSRQGKSLGRIPMELPAGAGAGQIPFVASLPSGSLRPGPYEMTAIVTQGAQVVEQKTTFNLEGPEPPPEIVTSAAGVEVEKSGPSAPSQESANGVAPEPAAMRAPIAISKIENAARPDATELGRTIDIARQRALEYVDSLPNFTCIQLTKRWMDHTGQKQWRARDSFKEMLRYLDKEELRQTLEINGEKVDKTRLNFGGVLSSGEFGMLLQAVFDNAAKADFTWKELASLGNQTCHVFSFRVERANSKYSLRTGPRGETRQIVGFHGEVYIETTGYSVRRISIAADHITPTFPVQESAISVDYDLVAVGDHDFVLPSAAEVFVRMGKKDLVKNEISFQDYRRFGAKSTILIPDQD